VQVCLRAFFHQGCDVAVLCCAHPLRRAAGVAAAPHALVGASPRARGQQDEHGAR